MASPRAWQPAIKLNHGFNKRISYVNMMYGLTLLCLVANAALCAPFQQAATKKIMCTSYACKLETTTL
jgi:hypothetical protein